MILRKDYDLEEAFAAIEDELISSMMRNMKRHTLEEINEDKQWEMWQALQLKSLEQYKQKNKSDFEKQFSSINGQIEKLIKEANQNGRMEQEIKILEAIRNGFRGYKRASNTIQTEFFNLNERKLDALIKATTDDLKKAEHAILRRANDQYRKAIFNAQVYANTGAGTYEKAVDMATKDMLASGLNCVEYANGARHTLKDYADMAIRTASKRAYLQGEGTMRQNWGISTVIINKRGNPCPKCLPFCGKVLIDDVWSGGSADDGPYPLMSSAIAAGLYHPRCKDSHTTYFEGVSTPPDDVYTQEEIEEIKEGYTIEQKQQVAKKNYEKYSRMSANSLDEENKEKYRIKAEEWRIQYEECYKKLLKIQGKSGFDRDQFKRYREILKGNAPKKFEDFLKIKYNNSEEYGKLKHAYRIANQYENNSGNMDPMKVTELHDKAVERKAKFTGKARRKSNLGLMELDGTTYIANSQINSVTEAGYVNFKGDKSEIIIYPAEKQFETFVVGKINRDIDSENKLFEYAATVVSDGKSHKITMLSEKAMCPSCQGVMRQFKEKYPNVEVEVVSHKQQKAKKNNNHNPIFEIDTQRRYENENA